MALLQILTLSLLSLASMTLSESTDNPASWLRNCEQETPQVVGQMEGSIPGWLEGRLTRVGPGILHIGNTSFHHMFDGLAVLHMVEIQGGKATYMSRFLASEIFRTNLLNQRISFNGFGTRAYPDPCKSIFQQMTSWTKSPKDNCQVNVLQATDQLIAMTETDTVRVVDPSNLDVIGEGIKLNRHINIQRATAHPHVGKDGTIYNLASTITSRGPGYSIISHGGGLVDNAFIEATILSRWRFDPAYMHSFGITENYYILIESPLVFNVPTVLAGLYMGFSPEEGMKWYPNEQSRFRVIRRSDGEEIDVLYMTDKFFTFHHINAYEVDDFLVVDVCAIPSGEVIKALYLNNLAKRDSDPTKTKFDSQAIRYVLPVRNIHEKPYAENILRDVQEVKIVPEDSNLPTRSPSAIRSGSHEFFLKGAVINDRFLEMPRINYAQNGQYYRYTYGVGTQDNYIDFCSIIKLDIKTGKELVWSDPDYFVSEPVFIPEPGKDGEDSGVIVTILLHKEEEKSLALLILDARDFSEIAKVHFTAQGSVTPTFHGQFVSFNDAVHGY